MPPARPILAILAVLAAAAAGGCPDKENVTNIYQQQPPPVGSFPGTPVSASNLAIDGRAFSNPGEDVKTLAFFDSGRDTAIVLFTTEEGGNKHLYASYLNGDSFTPPVEIVGENQNPAAEPNVDQAFAAFLFPGNSRDGDAIVGFTRMDLDDDGNVNPNVGPNVRLYVSYFDRSLSQTQVSSDNPDVKYGFDTMAPAIDVTDDTFVGSDVACAGFVSDGLHGAAEFNSHGSPSRSSFAQGDSTSYMSFVWIQANSSSSFQRLYRKRFDTGDATNAANEFEASAQEVGLDATANFDDYVYTQQINVCQNCVFFLKITGADYFLMASAFNPSAATPDFIVNAHRVGPQAAPFPTVQYLPGRSHLYGPDEGLVNVVGIFEVTGAVNLMEKSLFAFQFACGSLAAPFTEANDLVEFDNGHGLGPTYDVETLFGWTSFINRTGTWIGAVWFQGASPPPVPGIPTVFVNAIQTTRSGAAPALSASDTGPYMLDSSNPAVPVEFFSLQQEICYKGIQSDQNVISIAYKHEVNALQDTLKVKKVTFVPSAAPTLSIPASASSVALAEGTLDAGDAVLADGSGGVGAAGDEVLYVVKDAGAAPQESRRAVMIRPGGTPLEIGSLTGAAGTYSPRETVAIAVVTTPSDPDIAARPGWGGSAQHVFLTEYRYLDSQGSTALRHRVFDKTGTGSDALLFTPPADGSAPPADIDTGQDADVSGVVVMCASSTAGAYFLQGGHIWYNQFEGSWYPASASSQGPQLVDNLEPSLVETAGFGWSVYPGSASGGLDCLAGSAVFYSKIIHAGGSERLFARVRY